MQQIHGIAVENTHGKKRIWNSNMYYRITVNMHKNNTIYSTHKFASHPVAAARKPTLIAKFIGSTRGPPGADRTPCGLHIGPTNFSIWEGLLSDIQTHEIFDVCSGAMLLLIFATQWWLDNHVRNYKHLKHHSSKLSMCAVNMGNDNLISFT